MNSSVLHSNVTRRSEPLIWVRRVVLFESLKSAKAIRDVELHTGLNIVWGVEADAEDGGGQFQPGHGVGKTTFCRMIRYCLGESGYGQEHAAKEIRDTFPDGYIAAEIWLAGQLWSVLRPFDRRRADSALSEATIEELIESRPSRGTFAEFRDHLARSCMHGIRNPPVLTGGAPILWDHLLAMCSRDQEARYQNLWNWRSPRSASATPAFKQPKADAILCLRAVLDLLSVDETAIQQGLQQLSEEAAAIDAEISERRREPEYWMRRLRQELEEKFRIEHATEASLDGSELFGLPQLCQARLADLEHLQKEAEAQLKPLERQISLAAATLQEPTELQEQEAAAAEVTEEGTNAILRSIREIESLRQQIIDAGSSGCRYGQLPISQCTHAQQQLAETGRQLREAQQANLPIAAKRDQATAVVRERIERRKSLLEQFREQLDTLHDQRNQLQATCRQAAADARAISSALAQLQQWEAIYSGKHPDSKLVHLTAARARLAEQHAEQSSRLAILLSEQDERLTGIRQFYELLVTRTLSRDFHGRVRLSRDGLEFQIFRGDNLSGEAFETLSILLADLAVLLMGAMGQAHHPGILIHDSPREADLGLAVYRRFFHCVAEVASERKEDGQVPFQYIITTTTPPPADLRVPGTLLKLGGQEGQLFRTHLHVSPRGRQYDLPLSATDQATGGVE